ncbi:hypothetical protein A7982_13891 [Minicystis rosea]|nr:hypothetical protein A7982_13891 [Minicystis rosea]
MIMHREHSIRALVVSALVAAGCGGSDPDKPSNCGPAPEERAANQVIFDGLKPTCEGCHSTGARGYFASIEAFESLVAYEPKEVVPGKPDESELVRLLEGHGTRAFKQMPISGASYAELVKQGRTKLTIADVRAWVTKLVARSGDKLPSIEARRVTRIGAAEVQRALYQQLGLSDDDFFMPASSWDIPYKTAQYDSKYPISSPDAIPAPYEASSTDRYATLGGGSAMYQLKADGTVSPSFVGSLTQISQAWCAMALDKPNNTALLPAGASITVGMAEPAKVKDVLRAWFLHFHSVEAAPADVDRVFEGVFVPIEQGSDARTAYIAACSYFIRHPDWIFY